MQKLVKYEENGDAQVLKNTTFITTKTHIGFRMKDCAQFDNLSSNPNNKHIVYTPRDVVPDKESIKGTTKIAQVSGCLQPNSEGKWSIDNSLLPCLCPPCCSDPTNFKSFIFDVERETRRKVIKLV